MSDPPSAQATPSPAVTGAATADGLSVLTTGSLLFAVLLTVAGLVQWYWAADNTDSGIYRMGAMHGEAVNQGQWPRVLLSAWLHQDFEHWVGNLGGTLLMIGICQLLYTASWAWFICFAGAVAGCLIELSTAPTWISCGMSGGVYALLGCGLVVGGVGGIFGKDENKLVVACTALLYLMLQVVALWDPHVSHRAHLAGFATGVILGVPLAASWFRRGFGRGLGMLLVLAYFVTLGVGAMSLWSTTQPWRLAEPEPLSPLEWDVEGLRITLEIPETQLNTSFTETQENGDLRLTCGVAHGDPVVVSLITWGGDADPADLAAPDLKDDTRTQLRGVPRDVRIDGHRFLFLDCVRRDAPEIELPRWIGIVHGRWIDLEISIASEANARWRDYGHGFAGHLSFERLER